MRYKRHIVLRGVVFGLHSKGPQKPESYDVRRGNGEQIGYVTLRGKRNTLGEPEHVLIVKAPDRNGDEIAALACNAFGQHQVGSEGERVRTLTKAADAILEWQASNPS